MCCVDSLSLTAYVFLKSNKVDHFTGAFNGNGAQMDFLARSSNGGRRVVKVSEGSNVEIELVVWASSAEMSTDDS